MPDPDVDYTVPIGKAHIFVHLIELAFKYGRLISNANNFGVLYLGKNTFVFSDIIKANDLIIMLEKKGTKKKKGFLIFNTITLTQNNIIPQNIISNNHCSLNEDTFIDYLRGGT